MRPLYDEPEFVIRNIWRLYGGWYDGNPARLKPPSDAALGAELAVLAGGVDALIDRASQLSSAGEHRMACQLIEFAVAAEPESHPVHEARAQIYSARRGSESSLMAKGIYLSAKAESETVLTGEAPAVKTVLAIGEDAPGDRDEPSGEEPEDRDEPSGEEPEDRDEPSGEEPED